MANVIAKVSTDVKTYPKRVKRIETKLDENQCLSLLKSSVGEVTSTAPYSDPAETKPAKRLKREREEDQEAEDASKQPSEGTDSNHKLMQVIHEKKNKASKQKEGHGEDDNDIEAELSFQPGNTEKENRKPKKDTMVKEKQTSIKSRTENEGKASVSVALDTLKKAEKMVDKWNELVELNFDNPEKLSKCLKQQELAIDERDKARAFYLNLTQNDRQDADSDVAALKALERARNFVATIMRDNIVEEIPNSGGMKVMRNIPKLESGRTGDVVIRNITEPFWQQCIDTTAATDKQRPNDKQQVCAVGTPGIGKTTATVYLIRMLLMKDNTVVYLVRSLKNQNWYYEFIPIGNNNFDVAVYRESTDEFDIPSLKDDSTYYIVDPGLTSDSCLPNLYLSAKFILVSSPNEQHWGKSEIEKGRDGVMGVFLYFPIWKLEELLCAYPVLGLDLSEAEICDRYRQCGGVPRTIFMSNTQFVLKSLTTQTLAVSSLTAQMAEAMYFGKLNGVGSFGEITKSAVMGFDLSEYGNFRSGVPVIISALVYELVCSQFMTNLWNIIVTDELRAWSLFESYNRFLMALPNKKREFLTRPCVGIRDRRYTETRYVVLGGCRHIRLAVDIVDAAKKSKGIVFHSTASNHPLIDFIYQDAEGVFHAFQVTVRKTHSADTIKIKALEKKIQSAKNMLRLYYLVPAEKFAKFVTVPNKPNVSCRVYHVMVARPQQERVHEPLNEALKQNALTPVKEEDSKPAGRKGPVNNTTLRRSVRLEDKDSKAVKRK